MGLFKKKKDKLKAEFEKAGQEYSEIRKVLAEERKKHPNQNQYRIFRVEKDEKTGREKKITMIRFWAKDDKEAYAELKKYVRLANKKYTYYYGLAGNCIGPGGKRYDDLHDMLDDHVKSSFFGKIKDWFRFIPTRFSDWKWERAEAKRRAKTGHCWSEFYSLDSHILADIIYNVPLIKKNKSGCPQEFIDQALMKRGKTPEECRKIMYSGKGYDDDVVDEAMALYDEELDKIYLYVRLYSYYSDFGIVRKGDTAMEEIERDYKKTMPYIPGTYYDIDYKKLDVLERTYWNKIWAWIQKHGHLLST